MFPNKIAVLGPGLLGTSLARAVQERSLAREVCLWARRPEVVEEIQRRGWGIRGTGSLEEAVTGADLVVLATPVGTMAGLAGRFLPYVRPETTVTDVGSVKAGVDAALGPILAGHARWLGSHPMAGGEQSGLDHAQPHLFQGAACILTPTPTTDAETLAGLRLFWTAVGCRVVAMSPESHDVAVARISHVPHVAAAALVRAAVNGTDAGVLDWAGPGFRDCTRVALGSSGMWEEILRENRAAVLEGLAVMRAELEACEDLLRGGGDVAGWLESARATRSQVKVAAG